MIDDLLRLYDKKVEEYVKDNGRIYHFKLVLNQSFLDTCRNRIIEGHKKYGDDWKTKDNLKEVDFEMYDIFNYLMLDECQKAINQK